MAKILVIEDDADVRSVVRTILTHSGHQVVEATNGIEGVRLFRSEPVDLVITDIVMPEQDGVGTIMELRREFPQVKIIAISGGGRVGPADYLRLAEKLGAARTIAKPFQRRELLEAVEEVLEPVGKRRKKAKRRQDDPRPQEPAEDAHGKSIILILMLVLGTAFVLGMVAWNQYELGQERILEENLEEEAERKKEQERRERRERGD